MQERIIVNIPKARQIETLLETIEILGNYHEAHKHFEEKNNANSKRVLDHWKYKSEEFLKKIGYTKNKMS